MKVLAHLARRLFDEYEKVETASSFAATMILMELTDWYMF
jgi:hypothetical protein